MDILSYLAELIQTHKEVGLPELGTFFKKKSPGRYDAELHSFLPPSYSLNFQQEVTEETLLADHISKKNNISLESAQYYRDQFIENLKNQLQEKQEADLNTLGKLVLSNNIITLNSKQDLNLGFEFYGLPIVEEEKSFIPSVEEQETVEEPEVQEQQETLEQVIIKNTLEEENPGIMPEEPVFEPIAPEKEIIQEEIPVQPPFYKEPDYLEEPKKRTPLYLKIILGGLILAIISMILFLVKPELFDRLTNNLENTPKPIAPLKKTTDSLSKKTDSLNADSVKKERPVTPVQTKDTVAKKTTVPPTPMTPVILPEGITYEVIGSSVYGKKEANNFIAFMKKKWGIDAKIVSHRKGKKIKISIASFKDKATADSERARLEEKIKIEGLYVYPNTHKPE